MALTKVPSNLDATIATTQSASDNSTNVATTAYVTTAVSNLVDGAPGTLNTLNEIAAALNDDAALNTTLTNSIATKLPLAGGTMTGNIAHAGNFTLDVGGNLTLDSDGSHIVFADAGTEFGRFSNESSNLALYSLVNDKDITLKGITGGSSFSALTLDMSASGFATFNDGGSFGGQILAANGTASAPGYAFSTQSSTGMYKPGTNQLYFSVGGTRKLRVEAAQIVVETALYANTTLGVTGVGTFSSDVNIAGTTKLDGGNGYFRDTVGNSFSSGWDSNSDDHSTWINFEGYQGGTTKFRDLRIGNGKQTAFVHFDGSASTSNFSGNIYLTGNNDRRIKLSDSGIGGVSDSNNTVHIRGDNDYLKLNAAGNGGIIFEENGSEKMRITPDGRVGIGVGSETDEAHLIVRSPTEIATGGSYNKFGNFHVSTDTQGTNNGGTISMGGLGRTSGPTEYFRYAQLSGRAEGGNGAPEGYMCFETTSGVTNLSTERMRLTSNGNLLIGTSADVGVAGGGLRLTFPSGESDGDLYFVSNGGGSNATPVLMYVVQGESFSSNHGAMAVGRHTGNNRSINTGGTVNASGNDYAEYMVKSSGCGDIAKGDVVGVDADGELTQTFSEAKSFVIKSTDPSYVGGDTWWTEKEPEPKYTDDTKSTKTDIFKDWEARMETARGNVDRIAFSGQVPVNITGSFDVGDYVYPQVDSSGIKAVAKSTPTFEEYQLCVGKIWTTMEDGRPLVAVKIG